MKFTTDFNKINTWATQMANEFLRKKAAVSYMRGSVEKTGEIDTDMLSFHSLREDLFKNFKKVQKGQNHGMYILIDMSASMSDVIHTTLEQAAAIAMFCRKIGIPVEVNGFMEQSCFDQTLISFISASMNQSEFMESIQQLISFQESQTYHLGSTPLNTALIMSIPRIEEMKKKYNVQIMNFVLISDGGASDDFHMCQNSDTSTTLENPKAFKFRNKLYFLDRERDYVSGWSPITKCLLKLISEELSTNIIGVYLMPTRIFETVCRRGAVCDVKKAKNDKFIELTTNKSGCSSFFACLVENNNQQNDNYSYFDQQMQNSKETNKTIKIMNKIKKDKNFSAYFRILGETFAKMHPTLPSRQVVA